MEKLPVEDQILLFEAIRKYYPQSENKELILPMITQWFNERATQFLPASEIRDICTSYFTFAQSGAPPSASHPFSFRYA